MQPLTLEEFRMRIQNGETVEDLIREAQLRQMAEEAVRNRRPDEAGLNRGITPAGESPLNG